MLAFVLMILAFIVALFATSAIGYGLIFFIFGFSQDGFKNADMNLVLEIAPEDKRPVYVAIQSTIVSLGLFFSIPGGFVLSLYGYDALYLLTIAMLILGTYFTLLLKRQISSEISS